MQPPPTNPPYSPGDGLAPPVKKQRAGRTPEPNNFAAEADDAISKRRAELRRLQQQQRGRPQSTAPGGGRTSTDDLLERARTQLQPPTGQSSARSGPPLRGGGRNASAPPSQPPPMPKPDAVGARRRSSDLFPGVAKAESMPGTKPPPTSAAMEAVQGGPPPIARRLDPTFANKSQDGPPRSKSAPPSRPPPPSATAPPEAKRPSEAPEGRRPPPPRPGAVKVRGQPSPPKDTATPEVTGSRNGPPSHPPSGPPSPPKRQPPTKTTGISAPARMAPKSPSNSIAPPVPGVPTRTSNAPGASPPAGPPSKGGVTDRHSTLPNAGTAGLEDASGEAERKVSVGPPPMGSPPVQRPSIPSPGETPHAHNGPSNSTAGHTPFPVSFSNSTNAMAGHTPFPGKTNGPNTAMAGQTPFPQARMPSSETPVSPNTTRNKLTSSTERDLLPVLQDEADTPPITNKASVELRIQTELARSEKAKADALRRVVELEEEIMKLKRVGGDSAAGLQTVLQLAESQGDKSALDWVRSQLKSGVVSNQQVNFLSPMAATSAAGKTLAGPSPPRRGSLPRPKREQVEIEPSFLKQAVEKVEFEYVTAFATYAVRRPFGLAAEQKLWFSAGELNGKSYEKMCLVTKPRTLEVAAKIEADGSLFAIYGEGHAKHQKPNGDWEDFGNVYERDVPLGSVSFVDKDATEQDYSLDEIFEGAVAVRNYYCSSVISTAAGLKVHASTINAVPANVTAPKPKKETSEVAVGTEDQKLPPKEASKSSANKPTSQGGDDGPDVLRVFFGMFASGLLSLIWNVFIRLPLQILSFTVAILVSVVLASLVWMYMIEENEIASLGAAPSVLFNRPGIM